MMSNKTKFSKVENLLSRKIIGIYQQQLGHKLDNISYKLFDRTLIVILEGAITPTENLLNNNDHPFLAQRLRAAIGSIIQPKIRGVIEEVMNVEVTDFISDTTINSNITGVIAILKFKSNKDGDKT